MLDLLEDTQNFPNPLVKCCGNSGTAMPDSGGQYWPSKLATNIE